MHFYCIADEDTVRGFRLAGVAGRTAGTPQDATAALEAAMSDSNCGIVILTGRVAAGISARVEAVRLSRERPLIVVIPGPGEPAAQVKGLNQLVREATGVRIDPRNS